MMANFRGDHIKSITKSLQIATDVLRILEAQPCKIYLLSDIGRLVGCILILWYSGCAARET